MPAVEIAEYNGVKLQLGEIREFHQRNVYDAESGNRFLFCHLRMTFSCTIHPQLTLPVGPLGPRIPFAGSRFDPGPPAADGIASYVADLRDNLKTPRRLLRVPIGGGVIVESPQMIRGGAERLTCDAQSGPQPLDFVVTRVIGYKTVQALFSVETWLHEAPSRLAPGGGELPPSPILSHEWGFSEEIDDQFLATRVVDGRVIFRRDLLDRAAPRINPDEFRRRFLHPTPPYHRRAGVSVRQTPDGHGCTYRCVWREQPWGLNPRLGVRRVKSDVRMGYTWFSALNPQWHREWAVSVIGYPYAASHAMVMALESVLLASRVGDGRTVGARWSEGAVGAALGRPDLSRWPSSAVDVHQSRDTDGAPVASCVVRQALGKDPDVPLLRAGMLAAHGFTGDYYPESFGEDPATGVGGPAVSASADLPNVSTGRGKQLVALVSQALTADPYTPPPAPAALPVPRDIRL